MPLYPAIAEPTEWLSGQLRLLLNQMGDNGGSQRGVGCYTYSELIVNKQSLSSTVRVPVSEKQRVGSGSATFFFFAPFQYYI